ncbi:RHS repeat-associated core domain-containing protein, partial [Clostridium sp. Maddingley MBC34-26]|uniref:RHS repeat-associated core domain-containing protein n=2 Tax=unclassified Clostridium TaxID=2614128 RepID=UPI000551E499
IDTYENGFINSYGYNGENYDKYTGIQYLRARYYEPETGRFLTRDSYLGNAMNPLTLNRYAYTNNNPVMNIDPSGHRPIISSPDEETDEQRHWSFATMNTASTGSTVLQIGDSGDEVTQLQQKLIDLGYDLGGYGADGQFGPATQAAVEQFQQDQGIGVDGIVGRETQVWLQTAQHVARDKQQEEAKEEQLASNNSDNVEDKTNERQDSSSVGCNGNYLNENGSLDDIKNKYPGQYSRMMADLNRYNRIYKASPAIAKATPYLGAGITAYELYSGKDLFTQEELTTKDKVIDAASLGFSAFSSVKSTKGLLTSAKGVSNPISDDIIKQLNNAPIQTKLNKVTGEMEPYMKQIEGDDYKIILRRDVGEGFSHGEPNHWNVEVQTPSGNIKFDRHLYIDEEGNITKISDYIPQRRGKPIKEDVYNKDEN